MSIVGRGNSLSEAQINEILVRWEESRERGAELSVAALCIDCPKLMPEVERRLEVLRSWDRLAETDEGGGLGARSMARQQAPESAAIVVNLSDLTLHAQGGLGVVFRANDKALGRSLAVKLSRPSSGRSADLDLDKRFLREVKVTAALEHPGIVPVYGLGQDAEGRPCYAMRFITGKTFKVAITEYHEARKSRPKPRRSSLLRDVEFRALLQRFRSACVTVAFAHSRGFLHRDLKPEHILLGDFDVTLVVDWGLTKPRSDTELTPFPAAEVEQLCPVGDLQTETGVGTIGYASPEQQAGNWESMGPASDVFSLGAILYALLTDRLPFPGSSTADVIARVRNGSVVPPRRQNAEIPRALEAICLKALARLPQDRYRSAQFLADDLDRWLADASVEAYREPMGVRARRWLDRRRIALFAVLAAAAGGLGVAMASWHQQRVLDVENRSEAYVSAEKSAYEQVLTRRPGWVDEGLAQVRRGSQLTTPLRSGVALRSLAASCLSGTDLRSRGMLTSLPVGDLAFSPDGRWLAVGELSGFDAYRIQIIDVNHESIVNECRISTANDNDRHSGVATLGYSPDGRWLVAGLRNGKILTWDLSARDSQPQPLVRQHDRLVGVGFTPDGKSMVLALREGGILLYDWSGATGWTQVRAAHVDKGLHDLAVTRDGSRVVCAGGLGIVSYELSALRSPNPVSVALIGNTGPVEKFDIAPDDHTLAFSSNETRTMAIGTDALREIMVDPDLGVAHQNDTCQIAFSPDGTMVISGSTDNTVKLWDTASMRLLLRLAVYSESCVLPVFHPGGRMLAIGSSEGVALYDLLAGDVASTRAASPGIVSNFAFADSGRNRTPYELVVVRTPSVSVRPDRRTVELWKASSPQPVRSFPINSKGDGEELSLQLHAAQSGRRVLLHEGRDLQLFDLDGRLPPAARSWLNMTSAVCFARDGQTAWGALRNGAIVSCRLADMAMRTRWQYRPPVESKGRVEIVSLAAGSQWVVAGALSGQVLILHAADGQLDHVAQANAPVQAVALSPDESTVVCGTQRGGLSLIDIHGKLPSVHADAHAEMVTEVAFHPSGRYLATDSRSRFVILWRIGPSRLTELLRITTPFSRSASAIRFSPDGRYLGILAPHERAVRVWDLVRLRDQLKALGLDWDETP